MVFSANIEIDEARSREELVAMLMTIAARISDGEDSFIPYDSEGNINGDVVVRRGW